MSTEFDDDPITQLEGRNIPPDETLEVLDVSELIDAHLENEFANDVPTLIELRRVCPACGGDSRALEETDQPPASHAQAWARRGLPPAICHGNGTWFWCHGPVDRRGIGQLTIIGTTEGSMEVMFFPDRRLEARPVVVERRGPPKGKP